jgi:hypothetical protein
MNKKKLMSQANNSVNHLTIKDLPCEWNELNRSNEKNVSAELVELSEKNLQQVVGGFAPSNKGQILFGNIYFGGL